ncbi:unnamed protein product, partial [Mesorhabditis spiculigera]
MILRAAIFGLLLLSAGLVAQSMDEEESVSIGNGQGFGSGNGHSEDDEDYVQGSGLPPDRPYATPPTVSKTPSTKAPVTTTTQQVKKSQSTIITQRPRIDPVTEATTTTTRRPIGKTTESNVQANAAWTNHLIIIMLIALILTLVILIGAVLICRGCSNKKRKYRTENQAASANGLLSKTDY